VLPYPVLSRLILSASSQYSLFSCILHKRRARTNYQSEPNYNSHWTPGQVFCLCYYREKCWLCRVGRETHLETQIFEPTANKRRSKLTKGLTD